MRITFDQFIEKYDGKAIDFDGSYGNQCFDLYRQYCKEVLDIPQSPPTGTTGAVTIATNYLKEYLDKYENTPTGVPEKGDIVVWGKTYGPYGHVAVFISGDVNTFTSFDQNDPIGTLCHKQKHTYKGVLCWLRLKSMQETITQEQWQLERDERNKNWDLYQAQLEVVKKLNIEIDGLNRTITEIKSNSDKEIKTLKNNHNSFVEKLLGVLNGSNPLGLSSEELVVKLVQEAISKESSLQAEIKALQQTTDQEKADLIKENKELKDELERLQNEFILMEQKYNAEIELFKKRLDNVQAQFEENQQEVIKVDSFKTFIEAIIKIFRKEK